MFRTALPDEPQGEVPSVISGEMKTRISEFDWSRTSLGAIDTWPAELKTVVSMMLQSPQPTALLLSEEGILLYNDAYTILAGSRHPEILALSVYEAWPSAREFSARIQKEVFSGRALSFRNQELQLERNGALQRVWMNLDYSPIVIHESTTIGILATVLETTERVLLQHKLRDEVGTLAYLFEHAPGIMAVLKGPCHKFQYANRSYIQLIGGRDIIDKPIREALPELGDQDIFRLLNEVYQSGTPYVASAMPVMLKRDVELGTIRRFVDFVLEPILDENGEVTGIFVEGHDVTAHELAREELDRQSRIMHIGERSAAVGGWEYDASSEILFWTEGVYRIFEVEDEVRTTSFDFFRSHVVPEDQDALDAAIKAAYARQDFDVELRIVTGRGSRRDICLKGVAGFEGDVVRVIYGSVQDISQVRQTDKALKLRDRCLEKAQDGVLITDPNQPDNPIIYCNTGFTKLTGYGREEVTGRNCRFLQGVDTDREAVSDIRKALDSGGSCLVTIKNYRKDGSSFWNRLSITPVFGEDGAIENFIGVQTDVTEGVELNKVISHQASHDPLTDLYNRQEFEKRIEVAVKQVRSRGRGCHYLVYLDLDNFSVVNEATSSALGDLLLIRAATSVRMCAQDAANVARLGGDAFGLLLEDCQEQDALKLADRLLSVIRQIRVIWKGKSVQLDSSIGLARIDSTSELSSKILETALSACDAAKRNGGSQAKVYYAQDNLVQRRRDDLQLYSKILTGIEEDQFFLHRQIIVPLNQTDAAGEHFELLLRLEDPKTGFRVPPSDFIPAAERLRLAPRLDRWVIENALRTLSEGYRSNPFLCAINLSGASVNQSGFADYLKDRLAFYRIPPQQICLEITETAAIENIANALKFINTMRELGCLFALDDFGSGLSSYGYLRALKVDFVKIDGSFVRNMHRDEVDYGIVKSIHELALLMGKKTIAEFVDHSDIIKALEALGVHYAQGFAVGMPAEFK